MQSFTFTGLSEEISFISKLFRKGTGLPDPRRSLPAGCQRGLSNLERFSSIPALE